MSGLGVEGWCLAVRRAVLASFRLLSFVAGEALKCLDKSCPTYIVSRAVSPASEHQVDTLSYRSRPGASPAPKNKSVLVAWTLEQNAWHT